MVEGCAASGRRALSFSRVCQCSYCLWGPCLTLGPGPTLATSPGPGRSVGFGRKWPCTVSVGFLSCLYAGFGYGPPPPPPDQFAPPGVPPPPATPGAAPLAFPPPPSQAAPDMSKPPTAQPDFPYSQYGELETCRRGLGPRTWPHHRLPSSPPAGMWREARCAGASWTGSSKMESRVLVSWVLARELVLAKLRSCSRCSRACGFGSPKLRQGP